MKTALITGANKGIGFEVARQLADREFQVFVGARSPEAGKKAADAIRGGDGASEFLEIDVSSADSIAHAAQALREKCGQLDVLVNNAGIIETTDVSVLDVPRDEVERVWRTNTLGPLLVTQAFAPLLEKAERARVINVSSGWGALHDMTDEAAAYGISKAALNAVTRQFSDAFRNSGIAVNSVCPGWVRTDMGGSNATRSVEEGADTIVWLATEAPRNITGKFLRDRAEIPW